MRSTETLIDLARRHPRIVLGAGAFLLSWVISQDLLLAAVFSVVVAFQTKKDWISGIFTSASGYIDRSGLADDEVVRPSALRLVPPGELERQDEADADWTAPPAVEAAATRPSSSVRYGIAVPPRKPVDVPRR